MEGPEIKAVEAVIDNGSFGKRTLRFETGRLAQQADGAVAAGMPRAQAYEFAAAAVAGSAQLVLETGRHPGDLKDMVCSPGGTTIEGVRALEEGAFRASVMNAISACVEKAKAL